MNIFQKFFGYFMDENGHLEQFNDGLGHGFMDVRHLIWAILTIVIVIVLLKLSKKHKDKVILFCKVLLVFMFLQRLTHQIIRAILAVEDPFWRALTPAHLCTIMIYLLPIVVIFNIKKIKKPAYFFSVLGGVITILDGDYFSSLFLPFGTLEGMFAHTVIIVTSITLMHIEEEHFTLKDIETMLIMMAVFTLWATGINMILLNMGHDPNYLYLVRNMLPIGGKYFIFIYYAILMTIILATYFINNIKNMKQVKADIKANKPRIAFWAIFSLCYTYGLMFLNQLFNK